MKAAEELYKKLRGFNSETPEINHITAVQCAMTTVDCIIAELLNIEFNYNIDLHGDLLPYWNDVKIELNEML